MFWYPAAEGQAGRGEEAAVCPSGSAEGSVAAGAEGGKARSFFPGEHPHRVPVTLSLLPSCPKQPQLPSGVILAAIPLLLLGHWEQASTVQHAPAAREQAVWHGEDRDPLQEK